MLLKLHPGSRGEELCWSGGMRAGADPKAMTQGTSEVPSGQILPHTLLGSEQLWVLNPGLGPDQLLNVSSS